MKILLGIGGADDSVLALRETVTRVANTGDSLTVAVLADAHSGVGAEKIEQLAEELAQEHGVEPSIEIIEGNPGPALTTFAESHGFDRIVIGGGKRSPMGKISLGAITEFVVLNADTSVTLIR